MRLKALKPFVYFIAIMVIVSLACSAGSSTPAPEPQPVQNEPAEPVEPIETPQPVEPTQTPQPTAQQFFTEEFESDNGYWDLNIVKNAESSDTSKASAGINDGVFDFMIEGKNLTIYSFYTPYEYENVKIDLLVENRGTNDNQINIICRATENGWYEFSIANSGLYWIYAVDENGYRKLHDGGSTKIKAGKEFNEYSIICKERTLSLYINGVETRVVEENEFVFSQGLVGIGVSSFNTLPVEIEINSVALNEP
ncbi:MAG: hypothetical protein WBL25_05240 [Anaerolineales bacterium]